MKVILLSSFYKPSVGGVERQVEEIFLNLKKQNIDVKVYTTDAAHSGSKRLINLQNEDRVVRFRFLFGFGYFFRFAPMLVINLLFADFDVVHVHNSHDAHLLPVILIKLVRGKKLVITGHNPYVVDNSKRKLVLTSGVKFFDFILKFFIFAIDKYIALLNSEKNHVANHLGINENKIEVIPNGIREDYFTQVRAIDYSNIFIKDYKINKGDYKLVLGCLCRMDFVKGIQNLLLSVQQNPDCLFIMAGGDGGHLSRLKIIFKDYKNIFFTERYLSVDESLDFYSFIDVFLLPSVYEPFGITIVEAMTQGKYIIASSNGGPKEIINDTFGKIIDPLDFEIWSNFVHDIKENKITHIEKGKEGIALSYYYRWSNVIEKLIEVYKSLLLK